MGLSLEVTLFLNKANLIFIIKGCFKINSKRFSDSENQQKWVKKCN